MNTFWLIVHIYTYLNLFVKLYPVKFSLWAISETNSLGFLGFNHISEQRLRHVNEHDNIKHISYNKFIDNDYIYIK